MMNIQSQMTDNTASKRPTFLINPDLKLIIFGGKGGVGKTTSAAASAIYIAAELSAKRILLASIDPAHSLKDSLFDLEGLDNLEIMEIEAKTSLRKFNDKHQEKLKIIASRGTFLDDQDISQFLNLSIPGLDEVMAIIEITEFIRSSRYDMVVLDTAPTGHTLRFLSLPEVIHKWLNALDSMLAKHRYMKALYSRLYKKDDVDKFLEEMSKRVTGLNNLLKDGDRCEFVPVMIPEKLAIYETVRLLNSLQEQAINVKNIIINRVYEYNDCPFCRSQRLHHARLMEEIEHTFNKFNLIKIPLYSKEVQGIDALNEYSKRLVSIWKRPEDSDAKCSSGSVFNLRFGPGLDDQCYGDVAQYPTSNEQGATSAKEKARHSPIDQKQTLICASLDLPQIILIAGKGGVGKTTLSCATALQISKKHPLKKILLISTDPAHSLSDCLDMAVGERVKDISENLYALEIDAEKEYKYLKNLYQEEIKNIFASLFDNTLIDIEFDKDVMERLLDLSPPGLDEVMALTRIIDYLDEDVYNLLILDTAPTGHLIRFLELPELIEAWLKAFFNIFLKYRSILHVPRFKKYLIELSKKIKQLRCILVDQRKAYLFPVAIPTEMALEETKDMIRALDRLKIFYPAILLNMVTPESKCAVCSEIRGNQDKVIKDYYKIFKEKNVHIVFQRAKEPRGLPELEDLSMSIFC